MFRSFTPYFITNWFIYQTLPFYTSQVRSPQSSRLPLSMRSPRHLFNVPKRFVSLIHSYLAWISTPLLSRRLSLPLASNNQRHQPLLPVLRLLVSNEQNWTIFHLIKTSVSLSFLSVLHSLISLPHQGYSHAHPVLNETNKLLVKRAHEFIADAVIQELVNEHANSSELLEDSIQEEIAIYTHKLSLYLSLIDHLMSLCNNLRHGSTSENKVTTQGSLCLLAFLF